MPKKIKNLILSLIMVVMTFVGVEVFADEPQIYKVGCGVADITGPAAEIVMMGYADSGQSNRGIHLRLRARTFIINDTETGKSIVFVSTDTGMVFQSIRQGVIKKLEENGYGSLYGEGNLMMSAIHTHSGPAGYAHHGLYNTSSLGFIEQNYEMIIEGIFNSIVKAHNNLENGYVEIAKGICLDTSINRSVDTYNANPAEERAMYDYDVDKTMTVLTFKNVAGEMLGVFNWFAVHPTSMGVENKLISGDNKGLASYLYEKEMGTDYSKDKTFVAAFAQANAGDVSPNIFGGDKGYGNNDYESTMEAAKIQLNALKSIMNTPIGYLSGEIDYRFENVDMSSLAISPEYTDGVERRTYPGAMGYSFAAGADDLRTSLHPFFHEGMTQPEYEINSISNLNAMFLNILWLAPKFTQLNGNRYPELWEQHYPKPILFATSKTTPDPWTPQIVPIQLFKLGNVSIAAFPCEVTTMAGRRSRRAIKEILDSETGIDNTVIISGLANSYTSYLTTPEEYDTQSYEAASTQFGKWTLNGYIQEFSKLTRAILEGNPIEKGPELVDLSDEQVTFETGVVYDSVPIGKEFGEIHEDVEDRYSRGEIVKVEFWSGHPNNKLMKESSYIDVQIRRGDQWETVARDGDWETIYRWKRRSVLLGTSVSKLEWTIPADAESGEYRILHRGARKKISGTIVEYSGVSSTFRIE